MSHPPQRRLVVLRGAGDLATGVAAQLTRAGFAVVALELERPLTVRRSVSLSTAIYEGVIDVEELHGVRALSVDEAVSIAMDATTGAVTVPVLVSPSFDERAWPDSLTAVIDARLAKRNIDTTRSTNKQVAVIGLGPGFTAGVDVDFVIETNRGPDLGRVIRKGAAEPNTGVPGLVGGRSTDRVLRAPTNGFVTWNREIGDVVFESDVIGTINETADNHVEVTAPFHGVIRGLIHQSVNVWPGLKIGDLDARCDPKLCFTISDKALMIGTGVVRACQEYST